jgi:PAS domain S-box-containing protein
MDQQEQRDIEPEGVGLLLLEQRKLLEMVATGVPLEECLNSLCKAVPRLSPGARVCILLADEAQASFSESICPDFLPPFQDALIDLPIEARPFGSCAEAVYRGRRIVCADIEGSKKWSAFWRRLCVDNGIMACVSEPIVGLDGTAFGSFMLSFDSAREPNDWELRLVRFGVYVASIALTRERTTRALRKSEERYQALFNSIDAGFCIIEMVDGSNGNEIDFRLLEANPMFERMTGIRGAVGKTAGELAPNLEGDWFSMFVRVATRGEPIRIEKSAGSRWYEVYSYRVDKPEDRRVAVLIDDITSRKRRERNLRFLASVGHDLGRSTSVESIMANVGASIGGFLGLSVCSFVEIDQEADQAVVTYEWHRDESAGVRGVCMLSSYLADAFYELGREGELFLVNDVTKDPRLNAEVLVEKNIHSFLAAPVLHEGVWRFAMCVYRSEPHVWLEEEVELVQRLASRIWSRLASARTEEALFESERKLRQIFEAATDYAIFSTDVRGYINSWSPGAERLFGYEEREIVGRHADMIFTPLDRAEQMPRLEMVRALAKGVSEDERWHQRKDGTRFFASGLTQPIFDRSGQHLGYTKICRDRTSHQQAREWLERELVDSQRLQAISARLVAEGDFSSLLNEILRAAIAITHSHMGTVQLVEGENANILRLLTSAGFEPGVISDIRQLSAQDENAYSAAIRSGERVVIADLERNHECVSSSPYQRLLDAGVRAIQWTPLVSRSGRLLGIIATHWRKTHSPGERELRLLDLLARQAADLIERHLSEASLREREQQLMELSQSLERRVALRTAELQEQTARLQILAAELASAEQRERKRLAALLHDDLQQLLVAASMQLDLASDGSEEFRRKAVSRAAKWIEEARNAARDLTRQLRPPALYEDGLVAALHWLASEMKERHHLEVDIDGIEPDRAMTDDIKALLFECIRELLFNAAKYAGTQHASVSVREDEGCLEIVVADKGVGFDVESVGTSRQSGGFGLFSIRERLIALGGEMIMISALGEGTRIDLHVPLPDEVLLEHVHRHQGLVAPTASSLAVASGSAHDARIQVLVVDDHPMIREGIANILGSDSRIVVSGQASDGVEALNAVERHQPDVVLMDVNMPRMNGIEATREIRQRWPNIRIIGLSVQDDPTTAKSMRDAGAAAFISKSGSSVAMIAAILNQTPVKTLLLTPP